VKIETREIYKCDFCNKLYQRKNAAIKHEAACNFNPANFRACFGCHFMNKKKVELYFNNNEAEEREILHCDKLKIFLYPPKTERKGNAHDLGDEINMPMPKECNHRKLSYAINIEGFPF
jgi:hypothetical protein